VIKATKWKSGVAKKSDMSQTHIANKTCHPFKQQQNFCDTAAHPTLKFLFFPYICLWNLVEWGINLCSCIYIIQWFIIFVFIHLLMLASHDLFFLSQFCNTGSCNLPSCGFWAGVIPLFSLFTFFIFQNGFTCTVSPG